jgi:hypothetical protein
MQRIRRFLHSKNPLSSSCRESTTLTKFISMIHRHFTASPEETYLSATDITPSGTDTPMASTYFIHKSLYKLKIYDSLTNKNREIVFNEIEGAHKFMKEVLNRKDVKEHIARLRESKRLAHPKTSFYLQYGDLDTPLPSIQQLRNSVYEDLWYEYRLGSSDGAGCLRMYVTLYK